jgi:hypothetical protein
MTRTTKRALRPALEGLEGRQLLSNCYLLNVASGKVLDDPSGSTADGTKIQQYQLNGGLNQQWVPELQSDGNYLIANASSGKVLEDPGFSTANGTQVDQYHATGGLNQEWQFAWLPGGTYEILNAYSGKALDIPNGSTANGTIVQQYQLSGGLNQQWVLLGAGASAPIGPGYIANASSGKVLDDPGGSTASGTQIQQFELNGGSNQIWTCVPLDNGYDVIVNSASGLVLDDPGGSTAPGTLIQQYQFNGGVNQQWQLALQPDGDYKVVNQASGLVLDDPSGSTADGTKIQQFPWNGGLNQQWELFGPNQFTVATQPSGAFALSVNGDQASAGQNDTITVGVSGGGVMASVNGKMVVFDAGAVSSVAVHPWGGSNTVNVESTLAAAPVTVSNASGSANAVSVSPNAHFLDNIQGNVTVSGGGTNTLTVFDQNDPYSDTYTVTSTTVSRTVSAVITYGGLSALTVDGGYGSVAYNVQGSSASTPITLNAGTGNDTVNIGGAGPTLDAVRGALTLNGQAGSDILNLNDQGAAAGHTYSLNGSNLTRDGIAAVTFSTFETVNLTAGTHDDNLILTAMPAGVQMTMDMGSGYNSVYGPNTSNTWAVNGYSAGEGRATLNTLYNIYGISRVAGGTAPDRFVFTAGGYIPSTINGEGGGDTLDYSNYNAGVTVNLGAYGGGTYGSATGVGSSVSNIQNVIGSAYNDVLTGNIYGNVLVGGGGNDTITGGSGRCVLIGGTGSDVINGKSGNDLIIGGSMSYDLNPTALDAIFAEWNSSDTLNQREQYLSGPTGHYNGTYFLISSGTGKTVFDDGAFDTISVVGSANWVITS